MHFALNFFQKKYLLFVFGLLIIVEAKAQDLSAAAIPAELAATANAVLRYDETVFKIESKAQATRTHRYAVTILNEKGEAEHSNLVVAYDKFTKITSLEGTLYDATGKKLKSLKNKEIEDFAQSSDGGEISDTRYKYAKFDQKNYAYPYTIEFSYETRERNMMFYPHWAPISSYGTALQRATLIIDTPTENAFRHKEMNGVAAPTTDESQSGRRVFRWEMKNTPALQPTAYSLPVYQFLPMVLTAPLDFEVQDYAGTFTDWRDFGSFYYELNKGRDQLPETVKAELRQEIASTTEPREKIRRVYEWMQSKTRYVSIQLGIGGWQTIEAREVAVKGYGDCKALSNFTVALLREAGITAYPALVRAGADAQIEPDFPSSQFNHVIVCVPMATDTVWLECTSQNNPYNYLGDFTGNRPALLITPEGGKLVSTHRYQAPQNRRIRSAMVKLSATGDATVLVSTRYYGLQQENGHRLLGAKDATTQKNALAQQLEIPGAQIENYTLRQNQATEPFVAENLELSVQQFATRTGPRLFLRPAVLARTLDLPGGRSERTADFYLSPGDYAFQDFDSVRISLPAAYAPESLPPSQELESKFGKLTVKISNDADGLAYIRHLRLDGGRFPAADYGEWLDFAKKIRRSDRTQIALIEK